MSNRIYIQDWLEFKPYDSQTLTDSYYLRICNEVKSALTKNNTSQPLLMFLERDEINKLCCFLTSYFEDLISETNIWNSFINAHKRLYNKQLPFYELEEYYENDINHQDVCFLIWYFISSIENDRITVPYNEFIIYSAEQIMDIFYKEWEYAPENRLLKKCYAIKANEEDFYLARNLIDTLLFKTYLFYPDCFLRLNDLEYEIIENEKYSEHLNVYLNDARDRLVHNVHSRLLSLSGKEWVAELLTSDHKLYEEFLKISKKIQGYFLYKGQDDSTIFIEHIASGKKFDLVKKSFEHSKSLKDIDTIIYIGITKWKNEWWFSGIHFQQPYNKDLVLKEKKSMESLKDVNFLDHDDEKSNNMLELQFSAFKDYNNGSQIAFLPSDQIEDFYKGYIEFYNQSLDIPEKERERFKRKHNFSDISEDFNLSTEQSESGLVFFNPKGGIEMAFSINSAFPMSSNPFFVEEESEEDILTLLVDDSLSTELVYYCIENCAHKLAFFNEGLGKKYLDDIDFLLRFWKSEYYHTTPAISFMSKSE